jgi:hypothetical protein
MKTFQHIVAMVSAFALLIASFFQAHQAIRRAKQKVKRLPGQQALHKYLRSDKWLLVILLRPGFVPSIEGGEDKLEGDKDAAQELARDIRHLANVGRLWGLIVLGSLIAVVAELIDLLIDHHVL